MRRDSVSEAGVGGSNRVSGQEEKDEGRTMIRSYRKPNDQRTHRSFDIENCDILSEHLLREMGQIPRARVDRSLISTRMRSSSTPSDNAG